MVAASITYDIEREDRFLRRIAYQAAGIMLSSGNYKPSTQLQSVVDSVYAPLIPKEEKDVGQSTGRKVTDDPEKAKAFISALEEKMNTT